MDVSSGTTAPEISSFFRHRPGSYEGGVKSETAMEGKPHDYLKPEPANRTSAAVYTNQEALPLRADTSVSRAILERPMAQGAARDTVDGAVLSSDAVSVVCELRLAQGAVRVTLPRDFFPEQIAYGTPISFSLVEDQGFRRPVVSIRPLTISPAVAAMRAEADALLREG